MESKIMTTSRRFQRTKEDFTCERCGFFVRGSGYTNHCPQCLWSKHVDVNPGNRQAEFWDSWNPWAWSRMAENTPFSTLASLAVLRSETRWRRTTTSTPFCNSQAALPNVRNTRKDT